MADHTTQVKHQIIQAGVDLKEEIPRDAILNLIGDFFSSGVSLLALDGRQDIGKTHILRQFSNKHLANTISVFLRPHSWYLQDTSLLYSDLASQLDNCLGSHNTRLPESVDESLVRRLLLDLSRSARRDKRFIYFIIDGVEDIVDLSTPFLSSLVGILPFEFSEFRFLISGGVSWLPQYAVSKMNTKVYPVPGFSLEETTAFLSRPALSKAQVDELYRSFNNGTPGYLASAKRLLDGGMPAETLLSQLSSHLPQPFRFEWNSVESPNDPLLDTLAILAFDPTPHTLAELASIAELSSEEIRPLLARCTFLEVPATDHATVSFISASFRQYAASQLKARRSGIWNNLASHFLTVKETGRAAAVLPLYLEQAERPLDLLRFLSPATFLQLAESSDSFVSLQERSQLGFDAALTHKRYGDALRFSMQSSVVTDVPPLEFAKAEVLARLSLGYYTEAINMAQATVLKRHRLQLLAAVSRYQKTLGLTAEPGILDAITRLVEQLDPTELGDDLMATASDLMYSHPQLAIKLISHKEQGRSDDRTLDWALLKLSTIASTNSNSSENPLSDTAASIRSKIADPMARSFSTAMAMLIEESSVPQVLKQVKALDSPGDRIFLLRHWCRHTDSPASAAPIIDYAVYLSIRTTEYTPTARDYRDLAEPLPYIDDISVLSSLLVAFDIQKETARTVGPTQDFVQTQLLIAQAELRISASRSGQRLLEVFYEVDQIQDQEVKTVCLSLIVASLPLLRLANAEADVRDAGEISEQELRRHIHELLSSTADHYLVTRTIVEALSKTRADLACEIIDQLNYQSRRDNARTDLVMALLDVSTTQLDLTRLSQVIDDVADSELQENAIKEFAKRLARIPAPSKELGNNPIVLKLFQRAKDIKDPTSACRALSAALVFLKKSGNSTSLRDGLLKQLRAKWATIDDADVRLHVGYNIVSTLAQYNLEASQALMIEVDNLRNGFDDLAKSSFVQCIRLAIRAFTGLLPTRLESGQDLERLEQLVGLVSSRSLRVRLWSDLIIRCVAVNRTDEAKRFVNSRLRPLMEGLKKDSEYEWLQSVVHAAPALYVGNPLDTLSLLRTLPDHWRAQSFVSLCRYRATGVPDGEPFQKGSAPYHLDYDACVDLLTLNKDISDDATIYYNIEAIANSLTWKHNRHAVSQTQKNFLAEEMKKLVTTKLPSPSGIQHDGFAILGEAQALRLLREKGTDWTPLVARGRAIVNVSDRVFVLLYIAVALHSGLSSLKAELIQDAHELCSSIPSVSDRLGRLRLVAAVALDSDKVLAKRVLLQAAEVVKGTDTQDDGEDEIRRLVDLAYQLDPDFASSMASNLDGDAGRQEARKRVEYQNLKTQVINNKSQQVSKGQEDEESSTLSAVTWDLLGQLNATRIAAREIPASMELVEKMRRQPLVQSFPVLSFFVQNAVVRRGHADEAKVFLREMFEATLSACEVARAVITRAVGRQVSTYELGAETGKGVIIPAGARQLAMETIEVWLREQSDTDIYICDPFFGPKDLELLQMVQEAAKDCSIIILTSRKQQEHDAVTFPYEEFYSDYWRKNFSEQAPPRTEFVVVGGNAGELPIHDRWMINSNSGIRLGTSINGLGGGKDSEMSSLTLEETQERMKETLAYVSRDKREHMGQKLSYLFFELS